MKKVASISILSLLAALAVPALAEIDPATGVEKQSITLVKVGTAPTAQELAADYPAPTAYGITEEVPIQIPDFLLEVQPPQVTSDPLSRAFLPQRAPAATLSVEGYSNADNANLLGFRVAPPDTEGDVGQDYFVQYNNLGWLVIDKNTGAVVAGPFAGNLFWQGFGGVCDTQNAGDPIVLYDHLAGQWVFSQFTGTAVADGHQCFAVSQGSNPLGPYFLYDFVVSPGGFNDYPKIGLWPDGYYMTTNEFVGGSYAGVGITIFERAPMLAGAAAGAVKFTLPYTGFAPVRFSLQPSHLEGSNLPPAGTCNTVIQAFDDGTWGTGGGPDGYQFWEACADTSNINNSTFTQGPFVTTAAFAADLTNSPQPSPGSSLDTLGQFTMYRFQNRYFPGDGLKGTINHTVDVGGGVAGIRWAVFDIPSLAGISIDDTGTLDPGDGRHRWMGSAGLDGDGNLGLVYMRSSSSDFPSVYFTGRAATDPAGTLQTESVCIDGTGAQQGTDRAGDYSTISVDPVDECTFWATNEYVETTGSFNWNTRICRFRFPGCGGTVAAFEYGTATGDQPDPSSFRTVNLAGSFTNPIVVMGPPSYNGTQPTSVRVRNVTGSSFEYQIEEWDYLDQTHISEDIGYLVFEAGTSTVGSLAAEAGAVNINHNWTTVNFTQSFSTTPVVVAQTVTRNGGQAVTNRIRNVSTSSFQVRLQEEEANDGTHAVETVHWIAIEPGSATVGSDTVVAGTTGTTVTDAFATVNYSPSVTNPSLIADQQTFAGSNTAALRYQSLTSSSFQVKVEEEQSLDTEVGHVAENVGYIVVGN